MKIVRNLRTKRDINKYKRIIPEFTLDWNIKGGNSIPEYWDIFDEHLSYHFSKPIYRNQVK